MRWKREGVMEGRVVQPGRNAKITREVDFHLMTSKKKIFFFFKLTHTSQPTRRLAEYKAAMPNDCSMMTLLSIWAGNYCFPEGKPRRKVSTQVFILSLLR